MRSALLFLVALSACHHASTSPTDAATAPPPAIDGGLGAATFASNELDPASHGATITFEDIGASGWFPSMRDPAVGPCDAYQSGTCCLGKDDITSNALTPWDEDLQLTLRGPMDVKQLAVYQPGSDASKWSLVSSYDASTSKGIAFDGNNAENGFSGTVGTECLVNVSTDQPYACGTGSLPYCPPLSAGKHAWLGWQGSKMIVLLAKMAHASDVGSPCSTTDTGNWYDAPWLGLSVGELVRAGSFSSCQCYAKDPTKGYLGDGCGQFNVFEVVNDNGSYKNLDVFSTNFIGYAGYVGEGPCGPACDATKLPAAADLVDKSNDTEAAAGAVANPMMGPGAAFRRPELGYRYFVILLDVSTRTTQLAIVHPSAIPAAAAPLLPALPPTLDRAAIDALLALRLPH